MELLVIALVVVVAFAASTAFLWRSQSPFWRRLRRLLSEGDGGGLDAIAVDLEQADRALLDALGNRLVVSSLHGRADTRIFAKQVRGGRSRDQLSTKEEDAIRKALTPQQA